MSLRIQIIGLLIFAIAGMIACGDENIIENVDASIQRRIDLEIINDYIADQQYNFQPGDTTASGVRFVILDVGTGDSIFYEDIVDVYYVGRFTNREIFDTNIDTVDINNDTFDSTAAYTAVRFTHTPGGWAIRTKLGSAFRIGFYDGITAILDRTRIKGKAEVIIPSDLAFGAAPDPSSPFRDRVLVYEFYPVYKR